MLRSEAMRILRAALKAADPYQSVLKHGRLMTGSYRNVYVLGAGKASARMSQAVERLLGRRITAGLINVKYGHTARLRRIALNECGHPMPDENGLRGAQRILEMASAATERDLVICLISGGASALLPLPPPSVTFEEKQRITSDLLKCGATIHEFNCVRKHLSAIKGGNLARAAAPATVVTLILSDVIGDDLDVIGSGPTVPDHTTVADAAAILKKYNIPAPLLTETPKPGDPAFRRVRNVVVGSNRLAVNAAAAEAKALGFRPLVLSTFVEGETREVARVHAAIAKEVLASGRPVRSPACLISGGETTVTIHGNGLGGRNQEFVLAAAIGIEGLKNLTVLSAGTDGTDGPTDAAGAIADGATIARARALGLDPRAALANNDSYHFFESLGDLIKTGPTGTNVMDIRLLLSKS